MDYKYAVIMSILGIPFKIDYNDVIKKFPKNCFGVFVTIKRNGEVHGCIGKWDYHILNEQEIFNYMISVSHSASFDDSRSKRFNDIILDGHAEIEINFMLYDLKKIENKFDNSNYGVILTQNDKYIATYLPNVFINNESWNYIKNSLIKKGGLSNNNYIFYSYPTKINTFELIDIIKDKTFFNYWSTKISEKLALNNDIPNSMENGKFIYTKDNVRNISSIVTMLKYANNTGDKKLNQYINLINKYKLHYKSYDLQTLSFLIEGVDDDEIIDYFCNKALKEIDEQEKVFSKGEILLSMCSKCKLDHNYYAEKIKNLFSERENNIFQYNWHAKFFKCLYDKNQLSIPKSNMINELVNMFNYNQNYESNELVVMFECFMNTYYFTNSSKLLDISFTIFVLFMRRINDYYWINFKNGSSRLDITMHVLEAMY
jgi:hypothetical protein